MEQKGPAVCALRFVRSYVQRYFDPNRFKPVDKFCAIPLMQRRKMPLPMELFKKSVDEVAAMGFAVLDFNVTIGDPLLDPYLLERARYVTRNYPQFSSLGFVTTLQWLHRFYMDEFWDSGLT